MYPQYNYQRGSGRPPQQQGGYPSAYIESQRRYSPAVWDPQSYGGYYPGYAYYPGYYQQAPSHPPSGRGYHNNGSDRGHDRHGGRSHKPPKSNPVLEKARRTALTKEKLLRLKNEMCKLYLSKQTCYYYSFCQHAHGEAERRRNPASPHLEDYCAEICPDTLGQRICNHGNSCKYCRNNIELYYHPENYKTKICASTQRGVECKRGVFCAHAHSDAELNDVDFRTNRAARARYRDWNGLAKLIQEGGGTNLYPFTDETPLHYAAKYGNIEIMKMLLDKEADPNAIDTFLQSPLHKVAAFAPQNALEVAQLLIDAGASTTLKDSENLTPEQLSIFYNTVDAFPGLFSPNTPMPPPVDKSEKSRHEPTPERSEPYTSLVKVHYGNGRIKYIRVASDYPLDALFEHVASKMPVQTGFALYYIENGRDIFLDSDEDVGRFLQREKKALFVEYEPSQEEKKRPREEDDRDLPPPKQRKLEEQPE